MVRTVDDATGCSSSEVVHFLCNGAEVEADDKNSALEVLFIGA